MECFKLYNYYYPFGNNNAISRSVLTSIGGGKTCLKNAITDSELAQALHAYYGTAALWAKIFSANPGTETTYVSDIRVSSPQQFLYYAMLELEHPSDMRHIVSQRTNQSVGLWLAAVQQHFGAGYYSQLEAALMDAGNSSNTWAYQLGEQHIYGSSRVGLIERNLPLAREAATAAEVNYVSAAGDSSYVYSYQSDSILTFHRGQKRYELSNHLGNPPKVGQAVLAVITDRRIQRCNVAGLMYYDAQVVSVSDYYPFGMGIKEREWKDSSFNYRFGFNGQEMDNAIKGQGNSYDFGARIYDSRLGRWMAVDKKWKVFPSASPYSFALNSPLSNIDIDGNVVSGDVAKFKSDVRAQLKNIIGSELFINLLKIQENSNELAKISPEDFVAAMSAMGNNEDAKALAKGYYEAINSGVYYEIKFVDDADVLADFVPENLKDHMMFTEINGDKSPARGSDLDGSFVEKKKLTGSTASKGVLQIPIKEKGNPFKVIILVNRGIVNDNVEIVTNSTSSKVTSLSIISNYTSILFYEFWKYDPFISGYDGGAGINSLEASESLMNLSQRLMGNEQVYRSYHINVYANRIPDELIIKGPSKRDQRKSKRKQRKKEKEGPIRESVRYL